MAIKSFVCWQCRQEFIDFSWKPSHGPRLYCSSQCAIAAVNDLKVKANRPPRAPQEKTPVVVFDHTVKKRKTRVKGMQSIDKKTLERCAERAYAVRAEKTGSPPWEFRDAATHRRYRELVQAGIEALVDLGYRIVPEPVLQEIERSAKVGKLKVDSDQWDDILSLVKSARDE